MAAQTISTNTPGNVVPIKPYPEFEGHTIEYLVTKVAGTVTIPEDTVLHLDDRLRVISEWRVIAVNHKMDSQGKWFREQVIKVFDAPGAATTAIVAWDPSDPTDNGIVHSATCPGVAP
jgi:hypothetical protein